MTDLFGEYMRRVRLAEATKEFLRSDIGSHLMSMAEQEVLDGHDALEVAETLEDMRQAQARVWRGRSFIEWLDMAIEIGEEARSHFESGNVD